ncbi:SH3 domain-containing protein 2, partial [Zea mays]
SRRRPTSGHLRHPNSAPIPCFKKQKTTTKKGLKEKERRSGSLTLTPSLHPSPPPWFRSLIVPRCIPSRPRLPLVTPSPSLPATDHTLSIAIRHRPNGGHPEAGLKVPGAGGSAAAGGDEAVRGRVRRRRRVRERGRGATALQAREALHLHARRQALPKGYSSGRRGLHRHGVEASRNRWTAELPCLFY